MADFLKLLVEIFIVFKPIALTPKLFYIEAQGAFTNNLGLARYAVANKAKGDLLEIFGN